ncbi:hypothetical protein D3C87_1590070 [compost metagenome]
MSVGPVESTKIESECLSAAGRGCRSQALIQVPRRWVLCKRLRPDLSARWRAIWYAARGDLEAVTYGARFPRLVEEALGRAIEVQDRQETHVSPTWILGGTPMCTSNLLRDLIE